MTKHNIKRIDTIAAHELALYAQNNADIYKLIEANCKNLARKKARGIYDLEKAHKAMYNVATEAAKQYNSEFGTGKWYHTFNVPTRQAAAKEILEENADLISDFLEML